MTKRQIYNTSFVGQLMLYMGVHYCLDLPINKEKVFIPTVRFALGEEHYERLVKMAEEDGAFLQDCIHNKLFSLNIKYVPTEAVRWVLVKDMSGVTFTLPSLYEGEWDWQRGSA